jgi:hypothetical protein
MEFVLFAAVAIIAGGLREEIQRAFILHRCEQRLGGAIGAIGALVGVRVPQRWERRLGAVLGVIGFGLLFGAMHYLQGWSAVIITALLGTLWNLVYLARRSVVARRSFGWHCLDRRRTGRADKAPSGMVARCTGRDRRDRFGQRPGGVAAFGAQTWRQPFHAPVAGRGRHAVGRLHRPRSTALASGR